MTLTELIAALEVAKEGSRELDAAVWRQAGFRVRFGLARNDYEYLREIPLGGSGWEVLPRSTSSIDAALTLVPEGWIWHLWAVDDGLPSAELTKGERKVWGLLANAGVPHHPAIALCIASLKSRT